jgi:hypothetical protein
MDIKELDRELLRTLNSFQGRENSILNSFDRHPQEGIVRLIEATSNALNNYRESIIKYLSEKE